MSTIIFLFIKLQFYLKPERYYEIIVTIFVAKIYIVTHSLLYF